MSKKIDYQLITIPPDKDPKTYSVAQRRADILNQVVEAGGFNAVNYRELAEKYGKSLSLLYKRDKPALRDYFIELFENKEGGDVKANLLCASEWALKAARKARDYKEVSRISKNIMDMAFDLGILEKEPERVQQVGAVKFTFEVEDSEGEKPKEEKPEKTKKDEEDKI